VRATPRATREGDDAAAFAARRRGGRRLLLENGTGGVAGDGRA
jgi:hypothetical protein